MCRPRPDSIFLIAESTCRTKPNHKEALAAKGHEVQIVPHIAGGMNAIAFGADGEMTGAACWRADGTVSALGGGLAGEGIAFHI